MTISHLISKYGDKELRLKIPGTTITTSINKQKDLLQQLADEGKNLNPEVDIIRNAGSRVIFKIKNG